MIKISQANTDGIINGLVMVFAGYCSHDKSYQIMHPDTRTCPQYKSCTLTGFWLRSKLCRDTPGFDQNLFLDGKNHAVPSLHRDSFSAPLARGTRTQPGACVG
jgi:hypothetical protein